MRLRLLTATAALVSLLATCLQAQTVDLSNVPLWDGETNDASGATLNRFGGNPVEHRATVARTTNPAEIRTGTGVLKITTTVAIPSGEFAFISSALAAFFTSTAYIDTRDLTPFQTLTFWVRNDTGEAFTLVLELKDYRDDNENRAQRSYLIAAQSEWRSISAPLALANGWTVSGSADLARSKLITLLINANQGMDVSGSLLVDDMALVEKGQTLDVDSAPVDALLNRLAERQYYGDKVDGYNGEISEVLRQP